MRGGEKEYLIVHGQIELVGNVLGLDPRYLDLSIRIVRLYKTTKEEEEGKDNRN